MDVDSYKPSGWVTACKALSAILFAGAFPLTFAIGVETKNVVSSVFGASFCLGVGLLLIFTAFLIEIFTDIRHYNRLSAMALLKLEGQVRKGRRRSDVTPENWAIENVRFRTKTPSPASRKRDMQPNK